MFLKDCKVALKIMWLSIQKGKTFFVATVEPRFYDRRFNDIPDLMINFLCPGKSYSKLYGAESRFNNIRFNDIPGITMEI